MNPEQEADLVAELIERIANASGIAFIDPADPPTGTFAGVMPRRDGAGDVRLHGLSWPDGRLAAIDETGAAWFQHADGFVEGFVDRKREVAEQGPLGFRIDG